MDILDHELHEQQQQLLEKYSSRILTSRIVLLALIAYLYFEFFRAVSSSIENKHSYAVSIYSVLIVITTAGLIFTFLTYVRPFAFLLLLVILCTLGFVFIYSLEITFGRISFSLTPFDYNGTIPLRFALSSFALRSSILFFVIRGTVAARKYEQLRKRIKNQLI